MASSVSQLCEIAQSSSPIDWDAVQSLAQSVADSLGASESFRSSCTNTDIFPTLAALLSKQDITLPALLHLFRIIGNLCVDHHDNRIKILAQPDILKALFSHFDSVNQSAFSPTPPPEAPRALRSAIGGLLNLIVDCEEAQKELLKDEYSVFTHLFTVCRNAFPSFRSSVSVSAAPHTSPSSLANYDPLLLDWTLRTLNDLYADEESRAKVPSGAVNVLIEISLVLDTIDEEDDDLDNQLISAELAESLLLESTPAKLELDQNHFLVNKILDFIETDSSMTSPTQQPSTSTSITATTSSQDAAPSYTGKSETIVKIKSSLARCIMISMGESKPKPLADTESLESAPRIQRLVSWLEFSPARNDILTTACISLANVARNDEWSTLFVKRYMVVPYVARILSYTQSPQAKEDVSGKRLRPGEVTQLAHAVLGFLKHLAIPISNRRILSQSGIAQEAIKTISTEMDVVEPVQASAIGVIKHICTHNAQVSTWMVLGNDERQEEIQQTQKPIDDIIDLISRKDDARLKSEATRVLVQIVRSVWDGDQQSEGSDNALRSRAKAEIARRRQIPEALCDILRTGVKYPILLNEAIVALVLLSTASADTVCECLVARKETINIEEEDEAKRRSSSEIATSGAEAIRRILTRESSTKSADSAALRKNTEQLVELLRRSANSVRARELEEAVRGG